MIALSRSASLRVAAALVLAGRMVQGGEVLEIEPKVVSARGEIALEFRAGSGDARAIQSFLLSVTFDPLAMEVIDFAPAGDWLADGDPNFVVAVGTPAAAADPGVAGLAVIVDTTNDGTYRAIPPSPDSLPRQIAVLRILPRSGPGLWPPRSPKRIEFTDGAARFGTGVPMQNSLVIQSQDHYAGSLTHPLVLVPGTIQILLRGDGNGDGELDIADPISLISAQFLGGPQPPCPELADSNNDGLVDISDAVFLIDALFLGGTQPAPALSCL